jgi:ribosomal protein S18 acetylase RimI-like enzyme
MIDGGSRYVTVQIELDDAASAFSCGKPPLDDYVKRHAIRNDRAGISRAYVLRRAEADPPELPGVLGFHTLSMAVAEPAPIAKLFEAKLPKDPMPVALIGHLAIDTRAQGRRLGEALLMDALRRVVDAAGIVGCTGIIVDAKDEGAERFYVKYDFVTVAAETWPHQMFLSIATARLAFSDP